MVKRFDPNKSVNSLSGKYIHYGLYTPPGTKLDENGFAIPDTANSFNIWFSLEPITAKEQYLADQVSSETSHIIKTWYRSDLLPQGTITLGTRVFDIEGVINVEERNIEAEMLCKERSNK